MLDESDNICKPGEKKKGKKEIILAEEEEDTSMDEAEVI